MGYLPQSGRLGDAELAARLGSIVTFDRRGDVIFMDDFESGIEKWAESITGLGESVTWSSAYARSGGFSCKLATVANPASYCYIRHYFSIPVYSRLGLEFSFSLAPPDVYLLGELWIFKSGRAKVYRVRYDAVNNELQYFDSAGTWQAFATGVDIRRDDALFNTLKLVADPMTSKYVRFILNDTEYDLSAYDEYNAAGSAEDYIYISCGIANTAGYARSCYIDDVIITQNEP